MKREELLNLAKPILFNTEMVRAILEGRKTQTRRVVPEKILDEYYDYDEGCNYLLPRNMPYLRKSKTEFFMRCARYKKDDILYVRETWAECNIVAPDKYLYRADYDTNKYPYSKWSWHPSIHMPKEAARIFLKVTDVRVERLQDIDDNGVVAEGLEVGACFDELWDSTIKKAYRDIYGWDANPYVWVIEFEIVEV